MQNSFDAKVSLYVDFIVKNVTLGSLLASVKQIAKIRNRPEGVVRNEISQGRCPIPTILDGGRRVATVLACATYLAQQDNPGAAMPPTPALRKRGRVPKAVKMEARLAAGGAK